MKPLFTIHEGEFLVGDYINRRLGKQFDVWVPTRDTGVDLLVTPKTREGKSVGLQVKFSRSFSVRAEMAEHLTATSWFALDPAKVRNSQADLWVFVIVTLRHKEHFVVIPTQKLRKRIPRACGSKWNLYLWVFDDKSCYQVRDLSREEKLDTLHHGVRDLQRDFSEWLENWTLLDKFTGRAR